MTYTQLVDKAKDFEGVVVLERIFPHYVRRIILVASAILMLCLVVYFLSFNTDNIIIAGSFFILLAIWLAVAEMDSFYFSSYLRDGLDETTITYELADILLNTDIEDVTVGFLTTKYGYKISKRAGLEKEDIQRFIFERKNPLTGYVFEFDADKTYDVGTYVSQLLDKDGEFRLFLFELGIQVEDFVGSSLWVIRDELYNKRKVRWWSQDRLSQFEGIGVEWSYGGAYLLNRYSQSLSADHPTLATIDFFEQYSQELENVLSRGHNANALIVGEPGVGKEDIVIGLQKRINTNRSNQALRNLHFVKLNVSAISADVGTKQELEGLVTNIFSQSEGAGNVALVVNIKDLMSLGDEYSTNILSLLDPYLLSNDLHVIVLVDTDVYHADLEHNGNIEQRFERILIKEGDETIRMRILEDEVLAIEDALNVFFTYQAIETANVASDRYFTDATNIEKGTDLLHETAVSVSQSGRRVVVADDINTIVERLTGIPVGTAKKDEREKLLNLEAQLHSRIVGQNTAVNAISEALRRSRSGLADPKRPMGSFLFLGPTGVGKTETTKALADIFFGNSGNVVRLDMSEYSGPDALDRLIGLRATQSPGTLASGLRDNPYGVLHVDEFEKTNKEVMNLFLQILDEGSFTDAFGEEVIARNTIIVATSNAGSDVIYEYLKDGGDTREYKDAITNTIIKRGIFSPELLNRFDGVILFHPLGDSHLAGIVKMMLEDLNKRLDEKGLRLNITPELVDFLVEKGRDPKFGARPLRRAIQDYVENNIADKLISGEVGSGTEVTLDVSELSGNQDKSDATLQNEHEETFTFADED